MGTLVAGYTTGYVQALLAVVGMILSTVLGLKFVLWFFANWDRLHDPYTDPILALTDIWRAVRWALAGICIFFVGWLWALGSSLLILREAKEKSE